MIVLVDSSVWVAYFRGEESADSVDWLLEEAIIVTNDLILAELIPSLLVKRQSRLAALLEEVPRLPLQIEWDGIVQMQVMCLRHGINKVGIPDLILTQHAIQNGLSLFTLDRHFRLISGLVPLALY